MVEWDLHPTKPERCLDTAVKLDKLVQKTAKQMSANTLVLFTADHSFDFRVLNGKKGDDIRLPAAPNVKNALRRRRSRRSPSGRATPARKCWSPRRAPDRRRSPGFMSNTDLFRVMMSAYGWQADSASAASLRRENADRISLNVSSRG